MIVENLKLENFRNAVSESIDFCDGVNLLYGENAQGKTNAVEAVYYLAGLKSFRCPKYREMIAYDSPSAKISARIRLSDRVTELSATLNKTGKRTVYKNGVRPEKLSEYLGVFRAVLFCPEHLRLVKDGPGERRAFADLAICQLKPIYASLLNEFNRISAQRAALFRNAAATGKLPAGVEIWDEAYAEISLKISRLRAAYVKKLEGPAARYYDSISSGREKLTLSYQCDEDPEDPDAKEKFVAQLAQKRETELKNFFAPKGAHKDDIIIKLNGRSARFFASQGQQRSVVLSLKLAEGEVSREITGESPVFLLDDVLSELDGGRRNFILSNMSSGQVVITSCDTSLFDGMKDVRMIKVEKGKYCAGEARASEK